MSVSQIPVSSLCGRRGAVALSRSQAARPGGECTPYSSSLVGAGGWRLAGLGGPKEEAVQDALGPSALRAPAEGLCGLLPLLEDTCNGRAHPMVSLGSAWWRGSSGREGPGAGDLRLTECS